MSTSVEAADGAGAGVEGAGVGVCVDVGEDGGVVAGAGPGSDGDWAAAIMGHAAITADNASARQNSIGIRWKS